MMVVMMMVVICGHHDDDDDDYYYYYDYYAHNNDDGEWWRHFFSSELGVVDHLVSDSHWNFLGTKSPKKYEQRAKPQWPSIILLGWDLFVDLLILL